MEKKEREDVEKELASLLSTTLRLEDELNTIMSSAYSE